MEDDRGDCFYFGTGSIWLSLHDGQSATLTVRDNSRQSPVCVCIGLRSLGTCDGIDMSAEYARCRRYATTRQTGRRSTSLLCILVTNEAPERMDLCSFSSWASLSMLVPCHWTTTETFSNVDRRMNSLSRSHTLAPSAS